MTLLTPVAFIVFNRPETTAKVFATIAAAKPSKLFLIADGPRQNRGDELPCLEVRKIISKINWPCEVKENYSEVNLGCKERFSTGLNWVFSQVDEAIILEDDTLPSQSFFRFCQELLEKYRYQSRIMHICGDCFVPQEKTLDGSYYFSRYAHCWGWATWKWAWQKYDEDLKRWPTAKLSGWPRKFFDFKGAIYWSKILDSTASGKINSWAYRWMFSCWIENGLSIIPKVNLVSHIGVGANATHIKTTDKNRDSIQTHEINFPLVEPSTIIRNEEADLFVDKNIFKIGGLLRRGIGKMRQILGRLN